MAKNNKIIKPSKKFLKSILTIVRPILKVVYPFEIHGFENIKKIESEGYIICANHLSNIDPIFIISYYPEMIYFMGKSELFKNKFSNWFFRKIGVFPVHRGQKDNVALDVAKEILNRGEILGIFPEGMRSKSGEFLRGKLGAAKIAKDLNAKVLPVCITGSGKNNKIKIFKKTIINFGTPILPNELIFGEGDFKDLKSASKLIMERISDMRKQN